MAVRRHLHIGQLQHHILHRTMRLVDHVPEKVCVIVQLLIQKYVNIIKRKRFNIKQNELKLITEAAAMIGGYRQILIKKN